LAMGSDQVGLAQPFLEAALEKNPEAALDRKLDLLEYELKVAMFCTGVQKISDFKANKVWQWQNT
jgi:isopentenyl-diphosphate delta-isomerase